jgi:flavin-dependent dehydrogenase
MSYAARLRQAYPFKAPSTYVDHLVVGGGVVGLSVAAALVNRGGKGRSTFLVERRGQVSSVRGVEESWTDTEQDVARPRNHVRVMGHEL